MSSRGSQKKKKSQDQDQIESLYKTKMDILDVTYIQGMNIILT